MTQISRPVGQHFGPGALTIQQGIYEQSSTQKHRLGERLQLGDRVFYYAKSDTTGLVDAGKLVTTPALAGATTTLQGQAAVGAATVADAMSFTCTALTTNQSANVFDEGYVGLWDSTDDSVYTLRIKTQAAFTTTTAGTITLYDPIPVALATTDKAAFQINLFNGVVLAATTLTGAIIGVNPIIVTASYYFWLQTWGPVAIHIEDATTNVSVGYNVQQGGSTAGTGINAGGYATNNAGVWTASWLDEYQGFLILKCMP